jgi:hypothetical protein
MEVDKGEGYHHHYDEGYEEGWGVEPASKLELDYAGEACLRCDGVGHYARECPTPKGKGTDGKGVDMNGGKGYKGYGVRQRRRLRAATRGTARTAAKRVTAKDRGKGFAGAYLMFGETGLRAPNCTKNVGGRGSR